MTATHTPGPWDYFVGNSDGRGLIRIEKHGTGEHIASMQRGEVSEANARLMAVSPKMLEKLVALIDAADAHVECADAVDEARAIVAQATGAP